MRKKITTKTIIPQAVAATAAVITLTSCSAATDASNKTEPPQGPPSVTLRVPETILAGHTADLVIESTGHEGKKADLYSFRVGYDASTRCTDSSIKPIPITLKNGPQAIPIKTEKTKAHSGSWNDTWYVLTGEGFSTPCGAPGSKTRTLGTFEPIMTLCTIHDNIEDCRGLEEGGKFPLKTGTQFNYGTSMASETLTNKDMDIESNIKPPTNVSATWIGPFSTLPEAKTNPCKQKPVTFKDTKDLEPGYYSYAARWNQAIKEPGVYRVILDIPPTPYSAPYQTPCETAPLVTVNPG